MRVDETANYYRVRQKTPKMFVKIRTPQWASVVADSVSKGSKTVMGKTAKGTWKVQSVIIRKRKGIGKTKAIVLARQVRCKIDRECKVH